MISPKDERLNFKEKGAHPLAPSFCLQRQPPSDIVTLTRYHRQNSTREAHEGQRTAEDTQAGARLVELPAARALDHAAP
jgi:hypothetical protein